MAEGIRLLTVKHLKDVLYETYWSTRPQRKANIDIDLQKSPSITGNDELLTASGKLLYAPVRNRCRQPLEAHELALAR
jgi:hypothetical protein